MAAREGVCACGVLVVLHFDKHNAKLSCAEARRAHSPVDTGRLFGLMISRNANAREQSLSTLRRRPDGFWQATIGGRIRGYRVVGPRPQITRLIDEHYNERAMRGTKLVNRRGRR